MNAFIVSDEIVFDIQPHTNTATVVLAIYAMSLEYLRSIGRMLHGTFFNFASKVVQ